MKSNNLITPHYLFEVSWEVCNKVGGIHTVLATKALNLSEEFNDRHLFIGPDLWRESIPHPEFIEEKNLLRAWRAEAEREGLRIRVGRWNLPSRPIAILVDFSSLFSQKDQIFGKFWESFGLNSLTGEWDYIESALFGYASAKVIESFSLFNLAPHNTIVAQFHEWMTGAAILYLKESSLPIATIFTTHATVMGRALAANGFPLYSNLESYSVDERAKELGVESKHSLERCAAQNATLFTTVSEITSKEAKVMLGIEPHLITPNGFEESITPKEEMREREFNRSREKLMEVATLMTGEKVSKETIMVAIGGRYEFKNKGIDLFLESMALLNRSRELKREVIAWLFIPAGHNGVKRELIEKRERGGDYTTAISHQLSNPEWDPISKKIEELHLLNREGDRVKVLFIPSYLDGKDGLFNLTYYQLLLALDLTLFPSYYEPWGYTPLESLAFGVPTLTTTLAGFGLWVKSHSKKRLNSIAILERDDYNHSQLVEKIVEWELAQISLSPNKREQLREEARECAKIALWDRQIEYYKEAYSMALKKIIEQKGEFPIRGDKSPLEIDMKEITNRPSWNKVIVTKRLPKSLENLETIARNLWWSWNQEAINLFKMVDRELWKECDGNPIELLDRLSLKRYKELEEDSTFNRKLEALYQQFSHYMEGEREQDHSTVAYLSMEYGLDKSLRIYSGGLGVLAGDYLKEASDMGTPLIAVGLLYKYGYFTQQLSAEGDQIAHYEPQDFRKLPVTPIRDEKGEWLSVAVALPGRNMVARLWRVEVGRVELILLDTDFEANRLEDRAVTHHLYGGDWENRLKQELLLGIGGIRALRKLESDAKVYHLNEGHAAFAALERVREYVQGENLSFEEAVEVVRSSSLYTTHTPVPAGHDTFTEDFIREYLSHFTEKLKISWEQLLSLGKIDPHNSSERFSMSNLAANLSQEINGVSLLHGEVSRKILSPLWPGYLPSELNVGHVTNGVHYSTWTAPEWKEVQSEVFGDQFQTHHYDKECFKGIFEVENSTIWHIRNRLRSRLIRSIKSTLSSPILTAHYTPNQVMQIKEALRDDILTIGFARRFATYKRAHLLFSDLERLERVVNNPERPVQFFFSGKAHPADKAGQDIIRKIIEISLLPQFIGKVLFIPDYDMTIAKHMVQGVDVWMNTPTRPLEASGTSGEKAAMNGVMHLSVLDGWWVEGYKEGSGWALPQEKSYHNQAYQDQMDAVTIYTLLESEIAPLFYSRGSNSGYSTGWIERIRETIAYVASNYTTNRMMQDYIDQYYSKLSIRTKEIERNQFEMARELAQWKRKMRREWPFIEVVEFTKPDYSKGDLFLGDRYQAELKLSIGELDPEEIGVELLIAKNGGESIEKVDQILPFKFIENREGVALYSCEVMVDRAGIFNIAGRFFAKHPKMAHRQEFNLVKWL